MRPTADHGYPLPFTVALSFLMGIVTTIALYSLRNESQTPRPEDVQAAEPAAAEPAATGSPATASASATPDPATATEPAKVVLPDKISAISLRAWALRFRWAIKATIRWPLSYHERADIGASRWNKRNVEGKVTLSEVNIMEAVF